MKRTTARTRSSISKARSYMEMGKFWGGRDLTEFWGMTRKVKVGLIGEKRRKLNRKERMNRKID